MNETSNDKNVIYYQIVELDSLPDGERLFFEVDGEPIALINIHGEIFAIGDVCPHDDGPLGDGELEGYQIICPRHGARFDIRSGEALSLPAVENTKVYPVRIIDNQIEIGIPVGK